MHKLLFLLWLLTLGTSLLIDARLIDDLPPLKLTLRMISSVVLVVAGFLTIARVHKSLRRIAFLVALGMLLGFLGDTTMASILGKEWFPDRLLGGMFFFGLGHLAYIAATELTRRKLQLKATSEWWMAIILWQIIGISIWYGVVALSGKQQNLHLPALAYCALLATTAGMTSGLAVCSRGMFAVGLGAALFFFSDALLAWQHFRGSNDLINFLVWATYGPGQMLIVFGYAYALRNNHATVSNN